MDCSIRFVNRCALFVTPARMQTGHANGRHQRKFKRPPKFRLLQSPTLKFDETLTKDVCVYIFRLVGLVLVRARCALYWDNFSTQESSALCIEAD